MSWIGQLAWLLHSPVSYDGDDEGGDGGGDEGGDVGEGGDGGGDHAEQGFYMRLAATE